MDKRKMKKLLILNLPYFLVGLFATNLGEAWRLAEGADSSAKIAVKMNCSNSVLRRVPHPGQPLWSARLEQRRYS